MKKRSSGHFGMITSCVSTTMVLILLGATVFFVTMARGFSDQIRSEMPVAVLLSDSIPAKELNALQKELREQKYVDKITYISKEQGAKETYESMGMKPGDFIEDNPILAEFELRLHAEYANKDSINRIAPQIKKNPYVTDIVYPIEEIDEINRLVPIVGIVLLSVAGLLIIITSALIHNTMRMGIYARRFQIHSMRLVGAKWSFIRRPFMIRAFWIGLISVTISGALIATGIYYLSVSGSYLAQLINQEVLFYTFGSIAVCGLLITMLCAFFSVNHYLRMRSSNLFLN